MRKLFIESSSFAEEVDRILDEYAYYALQNQLMENPDRGKVIPGTGGLRKLRFSNPRRRVGKRGGIRIIYLHIPAVDWIYFLDVYEKGEVEDLTAAEKKTLERLAAALKAQARRYST
jgi:hypothetical protein